MTEPRNSITRALNDRYVLEREIGSGGMATVYRATDVRHDRAVAVKILHPEIASTIGRERFLREIRILSHLTHPNILPLYDSGEAGDDLFYVMPFIEGRSLRHQLAQKTFLPLDDALRFGSEIGEALDFACAKGILHRDIKPENILIEEGHAVVADFGIAKAIVAAGGTSITDHRLAVGTAAYMSPEQGMGDTEVDGRSDLYSLAVVLYEMLAGGVPFTGPTPQAILARKTVQAMPSIRTIRPSVPSHVDDALRRGLAVVPADRFSTARELVDAVRRPSEARQNHGPALALGTAGLAAIVAVTWLNQSPAPPALALASAARERVAVAEFSNRTGDAGLDAVGFMAADWITEGLQRVSRVQVVPITASLEASRVGRRRGDSTASILWRALHDETGASVVVTGAYYRSGDTLLVQAQISDGRDGHLLVAIGPIPASVHNPAAAITELRTRTMGSIASLGDERVAAADALRDAPPTFEAYREFSDGMSAYLAGNFERATGHFLQAHTRDSLLATPLLFASISLSNLGRHREADSVASRLARDRDRLSPYYRDWLDYRRAFLAGDRPKALAAVRRLSESAPSTKVTYNLALEAMENGHVAEATAALASVSVEKGPMRGWISYWDVRGTLHHLSGEFDKELDDGAEARQRYPGRLYAMRSMLRATAALGRLALLQQILADGARAADDPIGTTAGSMLIEAADESAAHGHARVAEGLWNDASIWFTRRLASESANRTDSIDASRALYALGRWSQAQRVLPRDTIDPTVLALSGLLAVAQNDTQLLAATKERLIADRRPYLFGAPQVALARIAAQQGDTALALSALREAFRRGKEYDLWIHRTPEFDSLRNLASFRELVRRK